MSPASAPASSTSTPRVVTLIFPPRGIASRALTTRLIRVCSI